MNNSLKTLGFCCAFAVACAANATPVVTDCTMNQNPSTRLVTIKYKLDSYPAVVTLDVKTNSTVSIGGEHICNAQGAVWRKVTDADADGEGWCTITWQPDQTWPADVGDGFAIPNATVAVTAWPMDNTPDYMVVDIMSDGKAASQDARCTYYPAVDFLPGSELGQKGAITNNPAYKTGYVVMRKIMAKDVIWTMGSVGEGGSNETAHEAQLTNNYYIGVFEFTQGQQEASGNAKSYNNQTLSSFFTEQGTYRPVTLTTLCFIGLRLNDNQGGVGAPGTEWPNPPSSVSVLGKIRSRTGVDFDLPSEAEWEFAARAGHGSGYWGDGSPISIDSGVDANMTRLGRYSKNVTVTSPVATTPPSEGGTAIVGSYEPNSWGLYDMHGNAGEICLDKWANNNTSLRGKVNRGDTAAGTTRVVRGGMYTRTATDCRPAYRTSHGQAATWNAVGFRLACRAGLK